MSPHGFETADVILLLCFLSCVAFFDRTLFLLKLIKSRTLLLVIANLVCITNDEQDKLVLKWSTVAAVIYVGSATNNYKQALKRYNHPVISA